MELSAGVQSPGVGAALCREVLPSRDVLTHHDRIHAALSAPISWEELSSNFPSRCFLSRKYNFWRQGRWCLFAVLIGKKIFALGVTGSYCLDKHKYILANGTTLTCHFLVRSRSLSIAEKNQIIFFWLPHTREDFPPWASLIDTSRLSHKSFRV